ANKYRKAFFDHMNYGQPGNKWQRGITESNAQLLAEVRRGIDRAQTQEQRDQIAGQHTVTYTQGAVGGYCVPAGFVYDVEQATKYFAPILDSVRVIETATGQTLPYPTSNDTKQAWTQVSENGQTPNYSTPGVIPSATPSDVTLGHVDFNAWKGTTGLVRVSIELLQ